MQPLSEALEVEQTVQTSYLEYEATIPSCKRG